MFSPRMIAKIMFLTLFAASSAFAMGSAPESAPTEGTYRCRACPVDGPFHDPTHDDGSRCHDSYGSTFGQAASSAQSWCSSTGGKRPCEVSGCERYHNGEWVELQ